MFRRVAAHTPGLSSQMGRMRNKKRWGRKRKRWKKRKKRKKRMQLGVTWCICL